MLLVLATALGSAAEVPKSTSLRGKLVQRAGEAPALQTEDQKLVTLEADVDAMKVLNDRRVNGFEFEAKGHFTAPDRFRLDPNHARSLVVHQHGKRKMITYWCDVCSIRTYAPGPCVCCQEETELQLRDPEKE
jgi:hypothetical protein